MVVPLGIMEACSVALKWNLRTSSSEFFLCIVLKVLRSWPVKDLKKSNLLLLKKPPNPMVKVLAY